MQADIQTAFSLDGRLAVVTGAASGIGRETALVFARAGARVVLADRDADRLAEVARDIGPAAVAVPVDVAERAQVQALAARARALAPLDIWANVAGVVATPTPVTEVDEATLDRLLAINLKGTYWGSAAAARLMQPERRGVIINVSSTGADAAPPGLSVYCLTKAAVNMLTRSLAVELGPSGVRVNAIAPGFIDTPLVSYRFNRPDGSIDAERKAALFADRAGAAPLGRIGVPRDIAWAMLYLASGASQFMTGQVLRVNGGVTMA